MTTTPQTARVPMLTEVVAGDAARAAAPVDAAGADGAQCSDSDLVQSVLADLQQRVDLLLEYRLREALAPALARASDTLIRDMRIELASVLRDIVERSVAQELSRRRAPTDES